MHARIDGKTQERDAIMTLFRRGRSRLEDVEAQLDDIAREETDGAPERFATMEDTLSLAHAVREACLTAAVRAYEDAGLGGLCHEGRWG